MRALAATGFILAVLTIAPALARAAEEPDAAARPPDDYDNLGQLEKVEVDGVLSKLHRTVDHAPAGKTIGEIVIVSRPVFAEDEGVLTFFNMFHSTTQEHTIRRELLFEPGDPWNQLIVDESLRNLRDPLFHNVLVILPLTTDVPGRIDVLVVTRDVWSLRLSTRYEIQNLDLISLLVSLSENNLFGLRKRVTLLFTMDQGSAEVGPTYYDPNIAGTHMTLTALARLIFAREDGSLEGTHSDILLAYPLWSLKQTWAASLEVSHYVGFFRSFLGTSLRTYDAPETTVVETAPWMYKRRELATEAQVVRAFGTDVVQRVSVGHDLNVVRPALVEDFPADATLRMAFTRDVLPRSELASALFARWQLFTPVFSAYRDIDTFDFREDYQLGPSLEARVSAARTELGSDKDFFGLSGSASMAFGWGGGFYKVGVGSAARLQDGEVIDVKSTASLFVASPVIGRTLRVLASVTLDWLNNETNNRFFTLGGDSGLRGYQINQFSGLARSVAHLEVRTRPLSVAFLRFGAVTFWDAGDCAPTLGDLGLNHGVGFGVRAVVPQLDQIVMRADWAFALNGPTRGWPGRVSLGVAQVF
jgi:hypothetical protein